MFCGAMPCECNKPEPKAKAPRKKAEPKPKPVLREQESAPVPKFDPTEADIAKKNAIKEAMKAAVKSNPKPLPKTFVDHTEGLDDDMKAAIIALGQSDVLHPHERDRYKKLIESPDANKIRASAWKGRRNESN